MKSLQAMLAPRPQGSQPATGPIGIDLAQERLNVVQFDGGAGGPSLRAAASLAYPCSREELLASPQRLKALLKRALPPHNFKGRRVVSCLRPDEMRILLVNYATAGGDDATAIVAELRERLKGELATSVVDFLPIRTGDSDPGRRDALVVVAPRDNVERHLDLLEAVGLDAQSLDAGPAALARLISFVNALDTREKHPNVLLLNFGQVKSHVSVVWGRRLILDRAVDFGERALRERLTRMLGVSDEMAAQMLEDTGFGEPGTGVDPELASAMAEVLQPEFNTLVAEINDTLVYTASRSRGRSIDQIYVLGSVGRYRGIDRLLQQLLELPVEVLNPLRPFRTLLRDADLRRLEPLAGLALACGLGLRGMRDG